MMHHWGHGGMMGGYDGAGMIFCLMFLLLFLIGAAILIVWAVKQFTAGDTSTPSSRSDALEIAKERFARGEITKEEYLEIKRELTSSHNP